MILRKYLPGLVLLIASIALTAFAVQRFRLPGQSNMLESLAMDMNTMKPEPGSVPVGVTQVTLRRVQPELIYTGTVRGLNEISIAARVDGRLSAVRVYTGSRVRRGQLLASLSAPELGAQIDTAQAEQQEVQAELKVLAQEAQRLLSEEQTANASIGEAQAELKTAEANLAYWRERLPRELELYQAGGIAKEEYQRYQADHQGAESGVQAARQRLNAAESERKTRQALRRENLARQGAQKKSISRAGSSVRERQIQQGFTQITAPVSGVITERLLAPGSIVTAGTPILTLAQIDSVRIQVRISESDSSGLNIGDMLVFNSAAQPDNEIEASVSSISPSSGANTRTQIVEAIVSNPEGQLLPGHSVKVRLRKGMGEAPKPAIPERALVQIQGQDSVWTIRNGRAHLVPVTVEATGRDWVSVSELEKGTAIISEGYEGLSEGLVVTPVRWTENGPERLPEAGGSNRLHDRNGWTLQANLTQELVLKVAIDPKPPIVGKNTLGFELLHRGQHPITDARIRLETSMPAMNMPGPDLTANHKIKGRYETEFTGMSGLWQVVTTVETGGKRLKPLTFEFNLP